MHEPDEVDALAKSGVYDVIVYGHTHNVDIREGETLVVETTNFHDQALIRGFNGALGESLRVVERFTRVNADSIDYQFTVIDPTTWTRPWSGSLPMTRSEGLVYEYACHEGNRGMFNLLAGARVEELGVQSGLR